MRHIRSRSSHAVLAAALAIAAMSLSATASAQTVPVDLDCSSGFDCLVDSTYSTLPLPHYYAWSNSGGVTFAQLCPTSSTNGVAVCRIRCISARRGSVTVTVRDAYGLLIGSTSRGVVCD